MFCSFLPGDIVIEILLRLPCRSSASTFRRAIWFETGKDEDRGVRSGLVCLNLINHNGVAIVIWNPAIKTFKPVPKSPNVSTLGKLTVTDLGFGYHPGNEDYMVVRLLNVATFRRKYEVEVYTLSTDSWRKIACDEAAFY
ncbi:hypothetical protein HAX54_009895 [Datura stramonium]|uniref:F-box associated beta-propeller type 3 domain-containing protein n=1 Tax=Datura stramonium TaxID=4076 RepID=A0ABS8RWF9_DATST|nr:hypothetical protein [Datura stramonium]